MRISDLFKVITISLLLATNSFIQAKTYNDSLSDVEVLIGACSELIGIYNSRDKKQLLAAQTTSLSEALRAGYCKGIIEQYSRENYCYRRNWFEKAEFIAAQGNHQKGIRSLNKLLKMACND